MTWIKSSWGRKGGRANPLSAGWYWAKEDQNGGEFIKVFLNVDLFTCYASKYPDVNFDVYDFREWYGPLKNEHEKMPK